MARDPTRPDLVPVRRVTRERERDVDVSLVKAERSITAGIFEALARLRVRMDRADAYMRERDAEREHENLLDTTLDHAIERARDRARNRWRMN
jgi:hypothetical protein